MGRIESRDWGWFTWTPGEGNEACGWDEANKPYVRIGRDLQTGMLLWDEGIYLTDGTLLELSSRLIGLGSVARGRRRAANAM